MPRSIAQYLTECLIAYPVAVAATFLWALAANQLPRGLKESLLNGHNSQLNHFFGTPMLAVFWITAAVAAALVAWRARRSPQTLFRASRAGEWVWIVGVAYIVAAFFTYLPVSHHWARTALYELFVNTDDIGNIATAPFYMGIAYSLTRHLLRVSSGGRVPQAGIQADRAS